MTVRGQQGENPDSHQAGAHLGTHGQKGADHGKDVITVLGAVMVIAVLAWTMAKSAGTADALSTSTTLRQTGARPSSRIETVRSPAVAGQFYPADRRQLSDMVDGFLNDSPEYPDVWGIRGLISPHAGYVYSGQVAAYGYKQLGKSRYGTVIVLGPSHHVYLNKAYIPDVDEFETPLGRVPISPKAKDMLNEDVFTSKPAGQDAQEHSVEVQVPFLQRVLPPFKLIPIMVGDVDPQKLADALERYVDDDTLVVASTDLSHYKPYDTCTVQDKDTMQAMLAMDPGKIGQDDACGQIPVQALLMLAKKKGWRSRPFDYKNSGDTAGDKAQGVVGYASIGFYEGLTPKEDQMLIDIAQGTLDSHFKGGHLNMNESALPPKLLEKRGCFVTLNEGGQLRGCIGNLVAQEELYKCVIDNALNAAASDPRFNPVGKEELRDIRIEVSVLTDPIPLGHDSPDDLKAKLIPGVDGVILKTPKGQSTYLPVVWEQLPDKEEFLSQLCLKQGSPEDCWKTAEVYTYQAQEFHQDGFK